MPFTGSHPAAVLPLLGGRLPASALVIGTLAPDLPYYFSVQVRTAQTHTLSGVLGVDLVLGVFLFVVWHMLLVQPLIWIAPAAVQRRIALDLRTGLAGRLSSAGDLGWVCLALVIGGLTHVVLDMITHADMWTVRSIDALSASVLGLPLYRWLHVALSILGLVLLARFLADWWRRAPLAGPSDPVRPSLRWGVVGLLLGLATLSGLIAALSQMPVASAAGGQGALIAAVVAFFSTLGLWVIVLAVAWHLVVGEVSADRADLGQSDHRTL